MGSPPIGQPSSARSGRLPTRELRVGFILRLEQLIARQVSTFPCPGSAPAVVTIPAPAIGQGQWNGSPSAALDADGSFVLA